MDSAAPETAKVVEVVSPRPPRMMILRLPLEVRRMIYVFLFAMTRLSFGEILFVPNMGTGASYALAPAENALALLRTCKQISADIGTSWLRHVLFQFESEFAMLDKLAALPASLISQIRHVRVRTYPITVQWGGDRLDRLGRPAIPGLWRDDTETYNLASTLKFLPYLKLDRLTVLTGAERPGGGRNIASYHRLEIAQYHLLDLLIRHSSGWKELWFMCWNSRMLRWDDLSIVRYAQPMHWQSVLSARDNTSSSAVLSVSVYRSKTPRAEPRLMPTTHMHNPTNWEPFEQTPSTGRMIVHGTDPILRVHSEAMKEMLVVVKRGGNADYREKPDSPLIDLDMREEAEGRRWHEIRARVDGFDPVAAAAQPTARDVGYEGVDEYEWVFFYPEL